MNEGLAQLGSEVWAMYRPALHSLLARVAALDPSQAASLFAKPTKAQAEELAARREIRAMSRPGPKSGGVAVLPIHGVITHRDNLMSWLFGGTSVEWLTSALSQLRADDSVSTVLLDVDSPGGTTAGVPEGAAAIRALAESKHVVALSHHVNASAAYWLTSGADEIVATPEALTGSIGVYTMHEDWSKALEQAGVTVTYIESAPNKTEFEFEKPLTDEARAHVQTLIDEHGRLFTDDVAKGRGIAASKVTEDYGGGRILTSKQALDVGMIDKVGSYGATLGRLVGTKGVATPVRPAFSGQADTAEGRVSWVMNGSATTIGTWDNATGTIQINGTGTEPAEPLTFTSRLELATAEVAELAAIAQSRAQRRSGRQPLSDAHDEGLARVEASLVETLEAIRAARAEGHAEPQKATVKAGPRLDVLIAGYQRGYRMDQIDGGPNPDG